MRKSILLIIIIITSVDIFGQMKHANHWYFGFQCGLNFNSGLPIADTTGKLESIEGCASISDNAGNLLFYSNGEKVWNKNHIVMPNGNGIAGDQSCTQSSLIVPKPGNNSLYYLFTTDGFVNFDTRYSIIDMSLNGGSGDVTSVKNIMLNDAGTEELAGTMHCNAIDYWVVSREMVLDTLKFHSYLVSASGISSSVITKFSFTNPLWNTIGTLTFSQDGQTLCFSSFGTPIFIFDFNTITGSLNFRDSISNNQYSEYVVYSNALSPDAQKLYVTDWWGPSGYSLVSQYDLSASDILASRVILDSVDTQWGSPNGYGFTGQIRLAPDQKIYVSRWNQTNTPITNPNSYYSLDSLDVINSPNVSGHSCNFERNAVYLDHKPTMIGLPNFISNYTSPVTPTYNCPNSLNETSTSSNEIIISPNPLCSQAILNWDAYLTDATLIAYNLQGQIVKQIEHITGKSILFAREELLSGLYFMQVSEGRKILTTGKIVISDY